MDDKIGAKDLSKDLQRLATKVLETEQQAEKKVAQKVSTGPAHMVYAPASNNAHCGWSSKPWHYFCWPRHTHRLQETELKSLPHGLFLMTSAAADE